MTIISGYTVLLGLIGLIHAESLNLWMPQSPTLPLKAYVLVDADTGQILAKRAPDKVISTFVYTTHGQDVICTKSARPATARELSTEVIATLPIARTVETAHVPHQDRRISQRLSCPHADGIDAVVYAQGPEQRWVLIALGAKNANALESSISVILNYAEKFYRKVDINAAIQWPKTVRVYFGKDLPIQPVALPAISMPAHIHSWQVHLDWHRPLRAPITPGQPIASLQLTDTQHAVVYTHVLRATEAVPLHTGLRYYIDLINFYIKYPTGAPHP